jgi:hypothetical protein
VGAITAYTNISAVQSMGVLLLLISLRSLSLSSELGGELGAALVDCWSLSLSSAL